MRYLAMDGREARHSIMLFFTFVLLLSSILSSGASIFNLLKNVHLFMYFLICGNYIILY